MMRDRYKQADMERAFGVRDVRGPDRRVSPEQALIHTIRAGYGQEVEKRKPVVEQEAPLCVIRTGRRVSDVVS